VAGLRLRLGYILVNETVEPPELLKNDGTDLRPPIELEETRSYRDPQSGKCDNRAL